MRKAVMCLSFGMALVLLIGTTAFCDQEAECKALVDQAADSFTKSGEDYALKLINSSNGPFRKGEIYVFVLGFDGTMLAHAANRDLVHTNQSQLRDGKGNLIFQPQLEVATNQGSGWVEYYWLRHGEKEPTLKRTFVKRVPGKDILVAAGYYVK